VFLGLKNKVFIAMPSEIVAAPALKRSRLWRSNVLHAVPVAAEPSVDNAPLRPPALERRRLWRSSVLRAPPAAAELSIDVAPLLAAQDVPGIEEAAAAEPSIDVAPLLAL